MSAVVISVENLTKEYRLGTINHGTLYHDLQSWWARIRGKEDPNSLISAQHSINNSGGDAHFLALKDVSFDVKQGEVLGIIGRNGAGKSTLLKILSKVTAPTSGTIKIKGRVASLLEVGTGFHPELTGRENIFLNGAILGMTKAEIQEKFDEIVAFAEIEKFIDTPVKRYSSGMYVRLAFAVAAHLEPEILIVDEVLAVGDAQFQKKCLGKMEDVSKEGRTVLFVSHNMAAINTLCSKAIVLYQGSISYEGNSNLAIRHYFESIKSKGGELGLTDFKDDHSLPIQIKYIAIKDENDNITRVLDYHKEYYCNIGITLRKIDKDYYACFYINDVYGNLVLFTADDDLVESELSKVESGEYLYRVKFPSKLLIPGEYFVSVILNRRKQGPSDQFSSATLSIEVQDNTSRRGIKNGYRPAVVAPEIPWDFINEANGKVIKTV